VCVCVCLFSETGQKVTAENLKYITFFTVKQAICHREASIYPGSKTTPVHKSTTNVNSRAMVAGCLCG